MQQSVQVCYSSSKLGRCWHRLRSVDPGRGARLKSPVIPASSRSREMFRSTTICRWLSCVLTCILEACCFAQQSSSPATHDVVIKNAVVMTVTHGDIKNGSVYIKDGKIAAVGQS